MLKKLSNLPSIVWVFLIPIGIAILIGGIILVFELIATVEGVASLLFLIIGFLVIIVGGSNENIKKVKDASSGFSIAVGIVFFALMGMAIDQPGNIIYNKPIEFFYCPKNTFLARDALVSHPLPERTDITQNFDCVDSKGKTIESIDMWNIILVRFIEYVIIGYVFIGLSQLINKFRKIWAVADNQSI